MKQFSVILSLLFVLACGPDNNRVVDTDGGGTTEVPNGIVTGTVYEYAAGTVDTMVVPAVSATVKLYPIHYVPLTSLAGLSKSFDPTDTVIDSTRTDSLGQFTLVTSDTGRYNLIAWGTDAQVGLVGNLQVQESDTVEVSDTLSAPAVVTGTVISDTALHVDSVIVYMPGTPFYAVAGQDEIFEIPQLPADYLILNTAYKLTDSTTYQTADIEVPVLPVSGQVTRIDTITISMSQPPLPDSPVLLDIYDSPGAPSLTVQLFPEADSMLEFTAGDTILFSAKVFDSTGAWLPDYESKTSTADFFTWQALDPSANPTTAGTFLGNDSCTVEFVPLIAYQNVLIVCSFNDNQTVLRDTVSIHIMPGMPTKYIGILGQPYTLSGTNIPLDSVEIMPGENNTPVYLVITDVYNNLVSNIDPGSIVSGDTTLADVTPGNLQEGEFIVNRKAAGRTYLACTAFPDTIPLIIHTEEQPGLFDGMKLIQGGTFQMGSIDNPEEQPVHTVTVSSFWMDTTEVTGAFYEEISGSSPITWSNTYLDYNTLPACGIEWHEAVLFCNARSKRAGLDTVYAYQQILSQEPVLANLVIDYSVEGYRLPTEAEWEYACRAGTQTPYFWNQTYETTTTDDIADVYAWYSYNTITATTSGGFTSAPQTVAQKLPNAWGLYDMSGNAFEWCNDWFDSLYYAQSPVVDPTGPTSGTRRVLRGGSFITSLQGLQSSTRYGCMYPTADINNPIYCDYTATGFRCVIKTQ